MATTVQPLELRADSDPASVGTIRRAFRGWLAGVTDDADTVDDLVLAVSEALENVVDHAFAGSSRGGSIVVSAHQDGRELTVTIADDGCWRPAGGGVAAQYRGRGLSLIEHLADHSSVETGPAGTTVTLVHRCP